MFHGQLELISGLITGQGIDTFIILETLYEALHSYSHTSLEGQQQLSLSSSGPQSNPVEDVWAFIESGS